MHALIFLDILIFTRTVKTLLEKIKTIYNKQPGLPPERIGPTIGQNSELVLSLAWECRRLRYDAQLERSPCLLLYCNSSIWVDNLGYGQSGIDTMTTPAR